MDGQGFCLYYIIFRREEDARFTGSIKATLCVCVYVCIKKIQYAFSQAKGCAKSAGYGWEGGGRNECIGEREEGLWRIPLRLKDDLLL